jgi:primase-polymerase (primpol)-like protein
MLATDKQQSIEKPETFQGDLAKLPAALKPLEEERRWVAWKWEKSRKTGKWTKPPYQTGNGRNASNDDPSTWGGYHEAIAKVDKDGIGFNLLNGDIGAVDLDKCRDPETGAIDEWAQAIVDRVPDAYAEVTVSGTGLRIIGIANGASLHRQFTVDGGPGKYEVYRNCARFITISGYVLDGRGDKPLPNINKLLEELVTEGDAQKKGEGKVEGKRGRGRPKGSKNKKALPKYLETLLTFPDGGAGAACGA